jgi:hypothetical protein
MVLFHAQQMWVECGLRRILRFEPTVIRVGQIDQDRGNIAVRD